jgi:hypothetical protein
VEFNCLRSKTEPSAGRTWEVGRRETHTCKVTPTSLKSCTRSTVAITSFVNWSNTNTFQTAGPLGAGTFKAGVFPVDDEESFVERSIGSLRLSNVRRALV